MAKYIINNVLIKLEEYFSSWKLRANPYLSFPLLHVSNRSVVYF